MDAEALKLTYEEITSLDLYGPYESDADRRAVERVTDAATAKAAWAIVRQLSAFGDSPNKGKGSYWEGWACGVHEAAGNLALDLEAAGLPRPEEVA